MPALSDRRIAELIAPYLEPDQPASLLVGQLSVYLDLLLRWNGRTNLTAVRQPEQIVQRQMGESLFAARFLTDGCGTLLDFGSGAGFPGIPIQVLRPDLHVTLAESQGKKASFLREAVRVIGLASTVWAARAEQMPGERRFGAVAVRSVDDSAAMLPLAWERVRPGGLLLCFLPEGSNEEAQVVQPASVHPVPLSRGRLALCRRQSETDVESPRDSKECFT